jgi:hypothetical protein
MSEGALRVAYEGWKAYMRSNLGIYMTVDDHFLKIMSFSARKTSYSLGKECDFYVIACA